MKNLILLIVTITLLSCEREVLDQTPDTETIADRVATILTQEPDQSFDETKRGLFKGIFASYDLSLKGTIIFNLGNDTRYDAAVSLHKTYGAKQKIYFTGRQDINNPDSYYFESDLGSFTATVSENKEILISHFNYNAKDCYIAAFKKTRMADVTFSFGTYVDNVDATFTGNWDAITTGRIYLSPAGEHSTFPTELLMLDKVIITVNGNMVINSDTPGTDDDSFTEPCFYNETFPNAWYYRAGNNTYREFIGYNQTSTFAGTVATWNLSYYFFDGDFSYDTPVCGTSAATGFGNWSWNGQSGKLFVDTLNSI